MANGNKGTFLPRVNWKHFANQFFSIIAVTVASSETHSHSMFFFIPSVYLSFTGSLYLTQPECCCIFTCETPFEPFSFFIIKNGSKRLQLKSWEFSNCAKVSLKKCQLSGNVSSSSSSYIVDECLCCCYAVFVVVFKRITLGIGSGNVSQNCSASSYLIWQVGLSATVPSRTKHHEWKGGKLSCCRGRMSHTATPCLQR